MRFRWVADRLKCGYKRQRRNSCLGNFAHWQKSASSRGVERRNIKFYKARDIIGGDHDRIRRKSHPNYPKIKLNREFFPNSLFYK